MRSFRSYKGDPNDLLPPEQFLLAMSTVPRARSKVEVLVFMASFDPLLQDLDALLTVGNVHFE